MGHDRMQRVRSDITTHRALNGLGMMARRVFVHVQENGDGRTFNIESFAPGAGSTFEIGLTAAQAAERLQSFGQDVKVTYFDYSGENELGSLPAIEEELARRRGRF